LGGVGVPLRMIGAVRPCPPYPAKLCRPQFGLESRTRKASRSVGALGGIMALRSRKPCGVRRAFPPSHDSTRGIAGRAGGRGGRGGCQLGSQTSSRHVFPRSPAAPFPSGSTLRALLSGIPMPKARPQQGQHGRGLRLKSQDRRGEARPMATPRAPAQGSCSCPLATIRHEAGKAGKA
jgi:hypothetical protein